MCSKVTANGIYKVNLIVVRQAFCIFLLLCLIALIVILLMKRPYLLKENENNTVWVGSCSILASCSFLTSCSFFKLRKQSCNLCALLVFLRRNFVEQLSIYFELYCHEVTKWITTYWPILIWNDFALSRCSLRTLILMKMRRIADDYMIIIVLIWLNDIISVVSCDNKWIIITSAADFQCNFFVTAVLKDRKIIC